MVSQQDAKNKKEARVLKVVKRPERVEGKTPQKIRNRSNSAGTQKTDTSNRNSERTFSIIDEEVVSVYESENSEIASEEEITDEEDEYEDSTEMVVNRRAEVIKKLKSRIETIVDKPVEIPHREARVKGIPTDEVYEQFRRSVINYPRKSNALLKKVETLRSVLEKLEMTDSTITLTGKELKKVFGRVLKEYPLELVKLCINSTLVNSCMIVMKSYNLTLRNIRKIIAIFCNNPDGILDGLSKFAEAENCKDNFDQMISKVDYDVKHLLFKKRAKPEFIEECLETFVDEPDFGRFVKSRVKRGRAPSMELMKKNFEDWKLAQEKKTKFEIVKEVDVQLEVFDVFVVSNNFDYSEVENGLIIISPSDSTCSDQFELYITIPTDLCEKINAVFVNHFSIGIVNIKEGKVDKGYFERKCEAMNLPLQKCYSHEEFQTITEEFRSIYIGENISKGLTRMLVSGKKYVGISSAEILETISETN